MKKDFSRRVLLMALGTTPHLTTVTLSALFKTYPDEMPTEIHIVTTKLGAIKAGESYMSEDISKNILKSFYKDYQLPEVTIPESHIHVIPDADGSPLADIRTQSDSSRAADFIVTLVREICADPDSALHVSIVGGRKSMSMLLGSAMTFYGRDQDRISHVLSTEEQERSGEPYPSLEAILSNSELLSLGEIPFLRLRPILPKPLIDAQYSYGEIVAASQQKLTDRSSVEIFLRKTKWVLKCEGIEIKLEPRLLGLYLWLALRNKLGRTTETSFNSVPAEKLFFLRIQFVKVLAKVLTSKVWENNVIKYLGIHPDRLSKIERQLRNDEFVDAKSYYRRFISLLDDDERKSISKAAEKFSSNLSESRSKLNVKMEEALLSGIPDVTNRRVVNYQIESNEEKRDGCIYKLSLHSECISVPSEFIDLLDVPGPSFVYEWKRV